MIWRHLGPAILQQRIGTKPIERLGPVLEALDPLGGVRVFGVQNLARIFHAFVGTDLLADANFRRELLDRLPPEVLEGLAQFTNIQADQADPAQTVERILAQGWTRAEFIEQFVEALGLGASFTRDSAAAFVPVLEFSCAERPYKPLKDYQFAVHCEALQKLSNPMARFLIQMPTGSGKTRTAMEFVCEVMNRSDEDSLIVWVAHSEELCSQAVECFSEVWSHVGLHALKCYRCWGSKGKLPEPQCGRGIVFGSFQRLHSIQSRLPSQISCLSQQVVLVVVDEAHKVMAPTYNKVCSSLLEHRGKLVGLTATPGRSAIDSAENQGLANYFHDEIVQLPTGDNGSVIEMLRRKGVLSRLINEPLFSSRSFALSQSDRRYLATSFDLPPDMLRSIADDDLRNVEIIKRLREECRKGKRVIFFGCSVEHSKFVCALLTYFEIKAAHVDGKTAPARRRAIIQNFKQGDTQVVCNFGILTTGFDAPKTDVVFIARPTASVVLYSQMIGRGLRGPALGGTETCTLIDVRDNIEGFAGQEDLYRYFDEYWVPSA